MIEWRTDWENAPRNKTKFLILRKGYDGSPLISTAYFYWYEESSVPDWTDIAYWALQDAVKDEPLDEDGPPELSDMKWTKFPNVS